jgi:hypothetical protein
MYLYWNNETVSWYTLHKYFSLHFNTFNADINISKFQLLKKNPKFVAYHQTTARVPQFEKHRFDRYEHTEQASRRLKKKKKVWSTDCRLGEGLASHHYRMICSSKSLQRLRIYSV